MKIFAIVCCSVLGACQSPFLVFPGGSLGEIVSPADNFSFASAHRLIRLEVRPNDPYSVILRCVVIEGEIYLDAAPARKWNQFIQADPRVRVKLGTEIYQATAVEVTDKEITGRFLNGRTIYRLRPEWSP